MSHYHPPHDEALAAFDAVCWALHKCPDEDLYECARDTVLAFGPFSSSSDFVLWQRHFDAALAIVVTTAEPWDAILHAAAILLEGA